jgi:hypothetical protein
VERRDRLYRELMHRVDLALSRHCHLGLAARMSPGPKVSGPVRGPTGPQLWDEQVQGMRILAVAGYALRNPATIGVLR